MSKGVRFRCPKCRAHATIFVAGPRTRMGHPCPKVVAKDGWVEWKRTTEPDKSPRHPDSVASESTESERGAER